MFGNHVVVLSSLVVSEFAVKSAFEAALLAADTAGLLAIVLLAAYALAHHAELVRHAVGPATRDDSVRFSARTRLLLARILAALGDFVRPDSPKVRRPNGSQRKRGSGRAR